MAQGCMGWPGSASPMSPFGVVLAYISSSSWVNLQSLRWIVYLMRSFQFSVGRGLVTGTSPRSFMIKTDKTRKKNCILLTFHFTGLLDHSKTNKALLFLMYTQQGVKLSPGFPKEVIDVNEPQGKTGVSSSVLLKMTMLLNVTNKMGSSPSFSVACHFWVPSSTTGKPQALIIRTACYKLGSAQAHPALSFITPMQVFQSLCL